MTASSNAIQPNTHHKKHIKEFNAINKLLRSNLIDDFIDAFTPKKSTKKGTEPTKKGENDVTNVAASKEAVKKAEKPKITGFSLFTKIAKFALQNPKTTFDLLRLSQNTKLLKDKEFQADLIKQESTLKFVQHLSSEKLSGIQQILANQKIEIFQEGKILDKLGVEKIGQLLSNRQNLETLTDIGVSIIKGDTNYDALTGKVLKFCKDAPEIKDFLTAKGESIANFLKDDYQKGDAQKVDLQKDNEQKTDLKGTAQKTDLPPESSLINPILQQYGINKKFLDHAPAFLANIDKLHGIYEAKDAPLKALEKTLEMVVKDPELNKFISSNPNMITDILKDTILNTPAIKSAVEGYDVDLKMLKIVEKLLVKPEKALEIIQHVNSGDYRKLTDSFIKILANPENTLDTLQTIDQKALRRHTTKFVQDINDTHIPGFSQELSSQLRDGLFARLVEGVIAQNEQSLIKNHQSAKKTGTPEEIALAKNALDQSLRSKLDKMGMDKNHVAEFSNIFSSFLDKPQQLQKIWNDFSAGNMDKVAVEVLTSLNQNEDLKQYVNKHPDVFSNLIKQQIGVDASDETVKGFYAIVTNVPGEKVVNLMENYNKGEWPNLIKNVCDVLEQNDPLKEYLSKHPEDFNKFIGSVAKKVPNLEAYVGNSQFGNLANQLLKNPLKVKELVEASEKGKIALASVAAQSIAPAIKAIVSDPQARAAALEIGTAAANVGFVYATAPVKAAFNYATGASTQAVLYNIPEIITPAWLESNGETIRKYGRSELSGKNFEGNFDNSNLSDLNLKNADFTKVTSMNGARIHDSDFTQVKFDSNKEQLLSQSYGLGKAEFSPNELSSEVLLTNQKNILLNVSKQITGENAAEKFADKLENAFSSNKDLKNYVTNNLEPLLYEKLPTVSPEAIKHVVDYSNKSVELSDIVSANKDDVSKIVLTIIANIIADDLTKRLFQDGANRGQDGLLIRKMVQNACKEILNENPNFDFTLLATVKDNAVSVKPEYSKTIENLQKTIYDQTKRTYFGYASGGVYLPEQNCTPALEAKLAGPIKEILASANATHSKALAQSNKELQLAEAAAAAAPSLEALSKYTTEESSAYVADVKSKKPEASRSRT